MTKNKAKNKSISTSPPRGMRDFLPLEVHRRFYAIEIIRGVYESHGFEPLETPSLENISVLSGKYGEEGDRLLFKVLKRGDKLETALSKITAPASEKKAEGGASSGEGLADLGLRYDLTVPLARVIAHNRGKFPRLFKRYQIQPVWRADRPAKGRFREFYQCDVDIVGSHSPAVEVDLLEAAAEALQALGFDDFIIRLNHRKLLFGMLSLAGIEGEKAISAVTALDKLDKVGVDGVKKELEERGINQESIKGIEPLLNAPTGKEALTYLKPICMDNKDAQEGLEETRRIVELMENGPAGEQLAIDPCLARGLDYYTGAIFEIQSPALGVSLAGGGRYDNLIGMFSGEDVPACGVSLGLERIIKIMEELMLFPEVQTCPHLLVTSWSEELLGRSIELARLFRKAGLSVDTHFDPGKLGKQLKYAETKSIRFAAIIGPEEDQKDLITLKDLSTGKQETVSFKGALEQITSAFQIMGGAF